MFIGLDSEYKQDKCFGKNFGLNRAKPVKLGKHFVSKKRRGKNRIEESHVNGYYVPFLQQLESFLSMPEVQDLLHEGQRPSNFVKWFLCIQP
jgi:hypothetical protein